jgi:hypothetical protein
MYIDKSEKEFSINALTEEELSLIFESVILLYNSIPYEKRISERDAKLKLVKLKNAIEKEIGDKL